MAINKVVYGLNTLVDLTEDTVTPETLLKGVTAHDASGNLITGTANGLPDGGTTGQILAKSSDTDGDADWYSIHKLPSDTWYLPEGITESNVIAAYKFVDRPTQADALINVNDGLSYPLSIFGTDISWSAERGFYFPATSQPTLLQNAELFGITNVFSIAFGFSGIDIVTNSRVGVGVVESVDRAIYSRGYGYDSTYLNFPAMNASTSGKRAIVAGEKYANGVISGNWKDTSELFYNGQMLSVTVNTKGFAGTVNTPGIGNWSANAHTVGYMTAVVFYSTVLSAAQHLQLSDNIIALGGVE